MGDKTNIAWCNATWNPVYGCTKVSAGCKFCYAIDVVAGHQHRMRNTAQGPFFTGLVHEGNWTGVVKVHYERLLVPLRWSKPRRIFVASQSDVFHESMRHEDIAAIFGVMAAAPQHTFQLLTKRPERMLAFFAQMTQSTQLTGAPAWLKRESRPTHALETLLALEYLGRVTLGLPFQKNTSVQWPLPNVWLGVSVEDQKAADERIPLLLKTPAAVRFLSCEPLRGPIDLSEFFGVADKHGELSGARLNKDGSPAIGWVSQGPTTARWR